jgi:hypothetical protein
VSFRRRTCVISAAAFWILIVLMSLGVAVFADETNLITNPGFESGEQGGLPVGWSARGANRDWVKLLDEDAYAGSWKVGLYTPADRTSGWGIQSEKIPVTPGCTYEAAGMVKLFGARTQIYIEYYDGANKRIKPYVGEMRDNDEWTLLSIVGEAPEGSVYARVLLYMPPNVPSTYAYFDEITFHEKFKAEEQVMEEDTKRNPGTFYVSPRGDDKNSGSLDSPWATPEYAARRAIPGDTIIFLPGEYAGVLRPVRSGTAEAPIVFKALERRTARLIGEAGAAYALDISRVEHIHIEGFHIKPQSPQGRWLLVDQAKHIRIDDVRMEDARGGMPFLITHSEHIQVRDSIIQRYEGGNMARVGDSAYILFEGNSISRTGHSPFQFYPERSTRNVVIRGNVFHAAWGRNFEFFGTDSILFEHNIVANAFDGGRSASTNAKFAVEHGIFRFNRVFRNWGGALHLYTFREQWLSHIRLYNNVFDDNYEYGIAVSDAEAQMRDVVFVNNIFSRNDVHGGLRQVQFQSMGVPESGSHGERIPRVRFMNNVVSAGDSAFTDTIAFGGHRLDIDTLESDTWRQLVPSNQAVHFADNRVLSPRFVDEETYNHALEAGSPLIDGGGFLTRTVGAGEGRTIRVEDAMYFYDGFDIEGEQGDLVAVGSSDQVARIVKVDYETDEITLDRTVSWKDGDPVSLCWSGPAPDIGVYEHGAGGRPSVQVAAMPFLVRPGEEVSFSAVLHGIDDPVEIKWHLGDGTIAFGPEVKHAYDESYDYPVRVKVTTKSGEVFRGTGYVVVEQERSVNEPLLHSTFDKDDEDWWWYWKCYRPEPVAWNQQIDGASGNGVLRIANPGGGTLPLRVAPVEWDIDRYPWVFLRYRLSPGTPVGLYVHGFADSEGRGRKKWLAVTAGARSARTGQMPPYELIDDGEWHVLLMDVRHVRSDFRDIRVLKGLGMESVSASQEGDTYWLDEVAILPDESLGDDEWQGKLLDRQLGHVDILSPIEGAAVTGELLPDLSLVRYAPGDDWPIRQITVSVDDRIVFTASDALELADLRIDTDAFIDGSHELAVTLIDEAGATMTRRLRFIVRNWQVMRDLFEPPQQWSFFGETMTADMSKTSAESKGWTYTSELEPSVYGELTGKIKVTGDEEYLVWDAPGLRDFKVIFYTTLDEAETLVTAEAATGDSQWISLPVTLTETETKVSQGVRWTRYTMSGIGPEGREAAAFRLRVGANVPAHALGIEEVELEMRYGPASTDERPAGI